MGRGLPARDGTNPGAECRVVPEFPKPRPGLNEDVLHQVGGVRCGQTSEQCAVYRAAKHAVQLGKRVLIPRAGGGDDWAIVAGSQRPHQSWTLRGGGVLTAVGLSSR